MSNVLVLYSANSYLANRIARQYYNGLHYVWCAPHFNHQPMLPEGPSNPTSSSPADIYKLYQQAIKSGDRHSLIITNNKSGLRNGALKQKEAGIINEQQLADINWIIDEAELIDFKPLLYVIPFTEAIERIAKEVSVRDRANPFSEEYLIEQLPNGLFQAIEL